MSSDSSHYSNLAGERFWRETGGDGDGNSISISSSRDFLVALLPGKDSAMMVSMAFLHNRNSSSNNQPAMMALAIMMLLIYTTAVSTVL